MGNHARYLFPVFKSQVIRGGALRLCGCRGGLFLRADQAGFARCLKPETKGGVFPSFRISSNARRKSPPRHLKPSANPKHFLNTKDELRAELAGRRSAPFAGTVSGQGWPLPSLAGCMLFGVSRRTVRSTFPAIVHTRAEFPSMQIPRKMRRAEPHRFKRACNRAVRGRTGAPPAR